MGYWKHRLGLLAATACWGAGLMGCQTNPATGDKFFTTLSREQEAQIGAQAAPGLTEQFGGKVQNAQLQQYITSIGKRLAAETEDGFPQLEWEYTLLDSPVINAFALPGGKVFITRGLAEKLTSEAQVAGVLGHETGHVAAQHTARRIGQQTLLSAGLAVAGLAVGTQADNSKAAQYGQYALPALAVGSNLYLLKFSRDEESQADYLGMRYMSKLGYNPHAQLEVMEILKREAGSGRPVEFMSTHPLPETRIQRIQQLLNTEFKNTQNNANYKDNAEQYQRQFLDIVKRLPPPKQPTPQGQAGSAGQLQSGRAAPQQQRISRPAH
jgi:predicted Zn-dependent protease